MGVDDNQPYQRNPEHQPWEGVENAYILQCLKYQLDRIEAMDLGKMTETERWLVFSVHLLLRAERFRMLKEKP